MLLFFERARERRGRGREREGNRVVFEINKYSPDPGPARPHPSTSRLGSLPPPQPFPRFHRFRTFRPKKEELGRRSDSWSRARERAAKIALLAVSRFWFSQFGAVDTETTRPTPGPPVVVIAALSFPPRRHLRPHTSARVPGHSKRSEIIAVL